MKVGIIGLPSSGKTTVLNAVSGASAEVHEYSGSQQVEPNLAIVSVPDLRQDWLSDLYKPKKTTYATVELVDVAGVSPGQAEADQLSPQLLTNLRQVDSLVNVARAFDSPSSPHPLGGVDPTRDVETLELEMVIADLAVIEKRQGKIEQELKRKKGAEASKLEVEKELLVRLNDHLSNEKPLRDLELNEDEQKIVKGYTFLTLKPMMVLANIAESAIGETSEDLEKLEAWAKEKNMPFLKFCGKAEMEIAQLDEEERPEFMEALGIKESSRDQFIRATYKLLDLVAFFTVGEDEVKAWTIPNKTIAQEAAGKIHTDIQRGFIRAEVLHYDHLHESGSWNAAKEKGLVRLEGKEYLVKDGDCINYRFAV